MFIVANYRSIDIHWSIDPVDDYNGHYQGIQSYYLQPCGLL